MSTNWVQSLFLLMALSAAAPALAASPAAQLVVQVKEVDSTGDYAPDLVWIRIVDEKDARGFIRLIEACRRLDLNRERDFEIFMRRCDEGAWQAFRNLPAIATVSRSKTTLHRFAIPSARAITVIANGVEEGDAFARFAYKVLRPPFRQTQKVILNLR